MFIFKTKINHNSDTIVPIVQSLLTLCIIIIIIIILEKIKKYHAITTYLVLLHS